MLRQNILDSGAEEFTAEELRRLLRFRRRFVVRANRGAVRLVRGVVEGKGQALIERRPVEALFHAEGLLGDLGDEAHELCEARSRPAAAGERKSPDGRPVALSQLLVLVLLQSLLGLEQVVQLPAGLAARQLLQSGPRDELLLLRRVGLEDGEVAVDALLAREFRRWELNVEVRRLARARELAQLDEVRGTSYRPHLRALGAEKGVVALRRRATERALPHVQRDVAVADVAAARLLEPALDVRRRRKLQALTHDAVVLVLPNLVRFDGAHVRRKGQPRKLRTVLHQGDA